jgi:hypothetical protein
MRYSSTGGDENFFMANDSRQLHYIYSVGFRDPWQSPANVVVLDYGGSVKIHAKPTDTAEKIIEELEKLLVIYKNIINRDKRDG